MGELTTASGADGKGWSGLRFGLVGPRPVTNNDNVSPAAAGLDAVTSVKSIECVIAGPFEVATTSGRVIGIRCTTKRRGPPPIVLRLAGSSAAEASRPAI